MPRFRPMAKLERNALADLSKYTLAGIPTLSGRIVYLATLRDSHTGAYKHHGLIASFGRDEAVRALRESHEAAFREWLLLSLAEKNEDLKDYLVRLDEPQDQVVQHWLQSRVYRNYVPASAMPAETDLFCRDIEVLLQLLRNNGLRHQPPPVSDAPDQDSSPLA